VKVTTNLDELTRSLNRIQKEQLPFALSKGLNETAKEFQKRQREGMKHRFSIRRKSWVERSVKIGREDWATKKKLEAIVRIETPGDRSRSDILAQHEEGGEKRGRGRTMSVPIMARPRGYGGGVVPKRLRPSNLNLRPWGSTGRVMRGDQRTILIRTANDRGVILQRTGKGKRTRLKVLYRLKGEVPLKPTLEFFRTARVVYDDSLVKNVRIALDRAVATRRK
jgi:Family of unknown function (DUF6441)